jgi:hypothetical protein
MATHGLDPDTFKLYNRSFKLFGEKKEKKKKKVSNNERAMVMVRYCIGSTRDAALEPTASHARQSPPSLLGLRG